ncbi:PREDICTED: arogenate dehydrogenase 2, chloroplastic-like [Nelumbo nucifera]|uniref:Arogenate dehydrogenase 2, chloroplastic-like n=1 Tax=Nelumbo nucifera TaxID=4432 RepID=A0A1U8B4F8_NELNU|nr:PREDICTED: arogenate dehydrogenase 2, chloroplastic-like [Nelumbo nucifera]
MTLSSARTQIPRHSVQIKALDAAQSYDYEAKINGRLEKSTKLKIAIIGFRNFGQFLAKTLVQQGHTILAHSRSNYSAMARELGVSFFSDPDDICEEHPEVILLCTSIASTKSVLRSFPCQRLKRNTLFVDVLSVKEFPKKLFLQVLPPEFDILCTKEAAFRSST